MCIKSDVVLFATCVFLLAVVTAIFYGVASVPFLTLAWNGHLSWTDACLYSAFNILWNIFWLSGSIVYLLKEARKEIRRQERNRIETRMLALESRMLALEAPARLRDFALCWKKHSLIPDF